MIADLQKAEKWRNEDLQSLWSTQSTAYTRVHSHILPFSRMNSNSIGPQRATRWYQDLIHNTSLKLSQTSIMHSLLSHNHGCSHCSASSYPPSSGAFVSEAAGVLTQLATFLTGSGSPLIMVDSYPYFAYASDPAQISLEYALFNPKQPIVFDGNIHCYHLFDAQVDDF